MGCGSSRKDKFIKSVDSHVALNFDLDSRPRCSCDFKFSSIESTNGGYNSSNNPQFLLVIEKRTENINITLKRQADGKPGVGFRLYQSKDYLIHKPKEHVFESLFFSTSEMESKIPALEKGSYIVMPMQNLVNEKEALAHDNVEGSISISTIGILPMILCGSRLVAKTRFSKYNGGYQNVRGPQFLLLTSSSTHASITIKVDNDLDGIKFVIIPAHHDKRVTVWPNEEKVAESEGFVSSYVKTRVLSNIVTRTLHPKTSYLILVTGCIAEDCNVEVSVILDCDTNATIAALDYRPLSAPEKDFKDLFLRGTGVTCNEFPKATVYDVSEARKIVQNVISICKKENALFADACFPAQDSSLNRPDYPSLLPRTDWSRPVELANNPQLFCNGTTCEDIVQGKLGDCQFCSAVASFSLHQHLVEQMFYPSSYSPVGIYAITLYFDGQARSVIIDDKVPSLKGKRIFAQGKDPDEFWFSLVEKAFAKLVGNYASLQGRFKLIAHNNLFPMLVNGVYKANKTKQTGWWNETKEYIAKSWPACALSIPAESNQVGDSVGSNGLVFNHAYTILNTIEIDGIYLIKLRNTWGEREWKGDWSDSSPLWILNPKIAKICDVDPLKPKDDGIFYISKELFELEFEQISLSTIPNPDFTHSASINASFYPDSCTIGRNLLKNTHVLLTTANAGCSALITLRRIDNGKLTGLQFKVFDFPDGQEANAPASVELGSSSEKLVFASKNFSNSKDVRGFVNFPVLDGQRFLIVPLLLKEDRTASFSITISSNQDCQLSVLPRPFCK